MENLILDIQVLENLLKALVGDKREIFHQFYNIFREHSQSRVEKMLRAQEEKNCKVLGFEAHTLKSSSAQIGLKKLSQTCLDLETHAYSFSWEKIDPLLKDLSSIYGASLKALESFHLANLKG